MTEDKLQALVAAYQRGEAGLETLAARAGCSPKRLRALLVERGVAIRKGGRPGKAASLQFGSGKAQAGGGPRLTWQQEQAERNARALADGRVRVYTPEERAALQAQMLGGGK